MGHMVCQELGPPRMIHSRDLTRKFLSGEGKNIVTIECHDLWKHVEVKKVLCAEGGWIIHEFSIENTNDKIG